MRMKTSTTDAVAEISLPVPSVESNYDEDENKLKQVIVWDLTYPDEAIISRLGKLPTDEKGNPTGLPRPITSRTYGKADRIFTGMTDENDNPIYFVGKLIAETKEALVEKQEEAEKAETV